MQNERLARPEHGHCLRVRPWCAPCRPLDGGHGLPEVDRYLPSVNPSRHASRQHGPFRRQMHTPNNARISVGTSPSVLNSRTRSWCPTWPSTHPGHRVLYLHCLAYEAAYVDIETPPASFGEPGWSQSRLPAPCSLTTTAVASSARSLVGCTTRWLACSTSQRQTAWRRTVPLRRRRGLQKRPQFRFAAPRAGLAEDGDMLYGAS
jgi:hypothetical protein